MLKKCQTFTCFTDDKQMVLSGETPFHSIPPIYQWSYPIGPLFHRMGPFRKPNALVLTNHPVWLVIPDQRTHALLIGMLRNESKVGRRGRVLQNPFLILLFLAPCLILSASCSTSKFPQCSFKWPGPVQCSPSQLYHTACSSVLISYPLVATRVKTANCWRLHVPPESVATKWRSSDPEVQNLSLKLSMFAKRASAASVLGDECTGLGGCHRCGLCC